MTEVAHIYLGNVKQDSDLAQLIITKPYLEVSLRESDRYKGRIHTHTDSGIAIGIIKSRDHALKSGDLFKTDGDQLILINLQETELMVLDLSTIGHQFSVDKLVNLGHALGNHHYPIMMQSGKIYVQLITDKSILEKLIKDLDVPGLQINYETAPFNHDPAFKVHGHH